MQASFQLQQTESHLKTLRIFHFVYGGLVLLMLIFLVFHFMIMKTVFESSPNPATDQGQAPDFDQIMGIMIWGYVGGAISIVVISTLNILSGIFLGKRKYKTFSLVVAGLNCLSIPLGTILGIFTIMNLVKPEALVIYGESQPPNL